MFTVYYTENDRPEATQIGIVSAPNSVIASQIAKQQFVNSTIQKILELEPSRTNSECQGARFINGEFLPVSYNDELV